MAMRDARVGPDVPAYLVEAIRLWSHGAQFVEHVRYQYDVDPTRVTDEVITGFPLLIAQFAQLHPPTALIRFHHDLERVFEDSYAYLLLLVTAAPRDELEQCERDLIEDIQIAEVEFARWSTHR